MSEDIFAGFNHTLRGGRVAYAEYVQVGKGRDVGMHQIYKFEAKLSQGNGEQMISRDVSRLGERLDMARLLSFYYSGPGFYLNVALTVRAKSACARGGGPGSLPPWARAGPRGLARGAHWHTSALRRRRDGMAGVCTDAACPTRHSYPPTAPPPRPLRFPCQVVCIYVFLYLQLWTSLFPVAASKPLPYLDVLTLEWTLQLGLLLIIPTFCFLAIEQGIGHAFYEIIRTVLFGRRARRRSRRPQPQPPSASSGASRPRSTPHTHFPPSLPPHPYPTRFLLAPPTHNPQARRSSSCSTWAPRRTTSPPL